MQDYDTTTEAHSVNASESLPQIHIISQVCHQSSSKGQALEHGDVLFCGGFLGENTIGKIFALLQRRHVGSLLLLV